MFCLLFVEGRNNGHVTADSLASSGFPKRTAKRGHTPSSLHLACLLSLPLGPLHLPPDHLETSCKSSHRFVIVTSQDGTFPLFPSTDAAYSDGRQFLATWSSMSKIWIGSNVRWMNRFSRSTSSTRRLSRRLGSTSSRYAFGTDYTDYRTSDTASVTDPCAYSPILLHGRQVPRLLHNHHRLLTRPDRRRLRRLLNGALPTHRWKGQIDRGMLVPEKVNVS